MTVALSIIILSTVIALGKILGGSRVCGISLGVAWILFVGLLFAHFGYCPDTAVLHFVKELGLIFFVYSIGMQAGPGFFSNFRSGGLRFNLLALLLVLLGVVTARLLSGLAGVPMPAMVGVMSGAVTNTPGLGAAQQACADMDAGSVADIAVGYAVAYPFGMAGCILSLIFIRRVFYRGVPAWSRARAEDDADRDDRDALEIEKAALRDGRRYVHKKIIVSKRKLNGMTLGQFEFDRYLGARILRIRRAGIALTPTPDTLLQLGDVVTVVGPEASVDGVETVLGNSVKRLDEPNLIPIFAGIALGCLLGSLPIRLPGLSQPVRLGLAGGPLIVSILLSSFGPRMKVVTYTTTGANLMIREIGISLFLASVGLEAGGGFVASLAGRDGLVRIACGALITVVPLLACGAIGRYVLKIGYDRLAGVLAGSMTNPPALAFATEQEESGNEAAIGYATVYPLTMFLRVLAAQLMIAV